MPSPRHALVTIDVVDLAFGVDGVAITVRRDKTDQEARGRLVALPLGTSIATARRARGSLRARSCWWSSARSRASNSTKRASPVTRCAPVWRDNPAAGLL